MGAKYNRTEVLNATIGNLVELLRDNSFANELNLGLKSENPTNTGVWFRFHHGVTPMSWGEKITITLNPTSPATVQIDILSECGLPTQIVDWGKNKQNVANIFEYIAKNIAKYGSSMPINQPQEAPRLDKKFCFNCGTQLGGGDAFCFKCATKQDR